MKTKDNETLVKMKCKFYYLSLLRFNVTRDCIFTRESESPNDWDTCHHLCQMLKGWEGIWQLDLEHSLCRTASCHRSVLYLAFGWDRWPLLTEIHMHINGLSCRLAELLMGLNNIRIHLGFSLPFSTQRYTSMFCLNWFWCDCSNKNDFW